ncbi:P-loop containing nucleoside triphosphate hydrolase protein [Coniochaeta sp. 2T2.1]|nr:P-loop containing nucleoside triphosphate hydrolase protein [Coniochaeta sp. 2T2.1]
MASDPTDTTYPHLPPIPITPLPAAPTEAEYNNTAPMHNGSSMQSLLAAYQRASEYYLRSMRARLSSMEGENARQLLLVQEENSNADLERMVSEARADTDQTRNILTQMQVKSAKQAKVIESFALQLEEAHAAKEGLENENEKLVQSGEETRKLLKGELVCNDKLLADLEDVHGEKDRYLEKTLEQQGIIVNLQTLIDGPGKGNKVAENQISRLIAASLQSDALYRQDLAEQDKKIASLESALQAKDARLKSLTTRLRKLEGTIEVAVRIRPGADASDQSAGVPYEASPTGRTLPATGQAPKKEYSFDNALEAPGSPAIFLFYGRTGTGKSHTAAETTQAAVKYLFSTTCVPHIDVSLCEIYKDDAFDLLSNRAKLPIPKQSSTNIHLPALATHRTVTSPSTFLALHSSATTLRTTASTNCNPSSSRSHALLTLSIPNGGSSSGVVAGGAAEAETRNINESLSDLRTVMDNLASRKKTPPSGKRTLARCFVGAVTAATGGAGGAGVGGLGGEESGAASSSPRVMLFATVRLDGKEHVAGTRATLDYAVRAVEMKVNR